MESVIEWEKEPKIFEYPCIKINQAVYAVLFTAPNTGTVVWVSAKAEFLLGAFSRSWPEYMFKPFHGKITLQG